MESKAGASRKRKIRPSANPPPYRPYGESRLRDTNPFHVPFTTKPPRAITADQILGIDKASYMRRIVPQSGSLIYDPIPEHMLMGTRWLVAITYCSTCSLYTRTTESHID
jgi:hypothetical protein